MARLSSGALQLLVSDCNVAKLVGLVLANVKVQGSRFRETGLCDPRQRLFERRQKQRETSE